MSRVAYVNGRYLPLNAAGVSVEDRGMLFADSVYEVCEVWQGTLVDEVRHLDRLARSLSELRIAAPMSRAAIRRVLRETIRRNGVRDGFIYLQVTRGAGRRDFVFPSGHVPPTVVAIARSVDPARNAALAEIGIAVVSVPDIRWGRVDIKTTALLASVLAKQQAKEAGATEAWFVDAEGFVTEGGSSNAWIVTGNRTLVTRSAEHGILRGITRTRLLDVLALQGMTLEERPFSVGEAHAAAEAFNTAATVTVMPVVSVDGHPVGDGRPGPIVARLRAAFHDVAERT